MRIAVLASGEGSNLQAMLDRFHAPVAGRSDAADPERGEVAGAGRIAVAGAVEVVAVGSDKPAARALARARAAGVSSRVFAAADFASRRERDLAMAAWLEESGVDLVVLAGYMQLLDPGFLARFPQRVINIHPALLPAFQGIRAVEQALAYGVKVFGVTVHFVDEGVDTGPVIAQRALELPDTTGAEAVRTALRPLEHALLCAVIAAIARGDVSVDPDHPRRIRVAGLDRYGAGP